MKRVVIGKGFKLKTRTTIIVGIVHMMLWHGAIVGYN